jgi:hypothetical protein
VTRHLKLRVADFSRTEDHFLTGVFFIAEECNVERRGRSNYIFSQIVAQLVADHFDGMLVPGVRGNRDARYNNVVVFQPGGDWEAWLEPRSEPYFLPEARGAA